MSVPEQGRDGERRKEKKVCNQRHRDTELDPCFKENLLTELSTGSQVAVSFVNKSEGPFNKLQQ